ncbi:hypothetical protein ACFSUC_15930 [Marinicrinis sediminis]|uniref:YbaK/aminoacyl-tRNA synthetase-associated domain-containing protein n=2 Tax=Marinicrinis sediminis TaxID=1652465 RepID=A0ABW5RDB1_9BACL
MVVKDMNLDTHEMLLRIDDSKDVELRSIPYDQVVEVAVGVEKVKKWFKTKQVPVLMIVVKNETEPYVVREDQIPMNFDVCIPAFDKFGDRFGLKVKDTHLLALCREDSVANVR